MTNAPAITQFCLLHFNKPQTAGIMANMRVESGGPDFPTDNIGYGDGGPGVDAIGICQWEGGRRNNLRQWAAGRNSTESDLQTQLTFMMHELATSKSLVMQAISTMNDPAAVAAEWDAHFEVSNGSARQIRINYAQQYYADLQANKVPESGGKVPNIAGTKSTTGGHPVAGASLVKPDPNAHLYPASKLALPLTVDEKNQMGQYIKTAGGYTDADIAKYEKDNGSPDGGLVAFYDLVATGGVYNDAPSGVSTHFNPGGLISWADGLAKFLSWITTLRNWERIGLFTLGAAILIFAVIELASGNTPNLPNVADTVINPSRPFH